MKSVDELFALNPSGDKNELSSYLEDYSLFYPEENIDVIYDKYKEYQNWWMAKFGDRDPKYVGKNDQLRQIIDFLKDGMMRQDFVLPKTSRDYYYFGDMKHKEMAELYEEFKKANNLCT